MLCYCKKCGRLVQHLSKELEKPCDYCNSITYPVPDELDGEIVVALFGEELVCKKLLVNNNTQAYDFLSNNPKANDKSRLNQKQGSFKIIGKVVQVLHAHIVGEGIVSYHSS